MKKRISLIAIAAALIALTAFALIRNKKVIDARNVTVDRSQVPVAVSVTKISLARVTGDLELPAVLDPSRQADISATTAGRISRLGVELGTRVGAGQVVGAIDTRQQQLNLKEAQEAISKYEADLQRNKELYEGNAGTAQSIKDAQHSFDNARIKAEQIRNQIGEGAIKSPISGMVVDKKGEAGEYVSPGSPIATVVDIYNLKAVVFVNEKDVYSLKQGQSALITTDVFPGKTFTGKVSFISPVGDENHNYRVELSVANSAATLKAGTYIKVAFDLGKDIDVLQVPKIALVEGTKNPYVYVVNGDKAATRKLTVGREFGENIEVLGGLREGDEVVTSGQINLVEGSKIKKINGQ
ncbi:efflux RND transporter periplasmic adaptor subunit [Paraflavisolibacter sp. H34]|uniref:efflux RND transporter periplasmic adaptor subunit n=1 Tax=Huijunlia imazamoxiresistens TaxID=3127457 RepID=UPI00301822AE